MMSPNTAITFSPIRVQNPRSGPWRKTHHTLTTSFTCMPTSWSSTTFESKPISAFRSIVTTEHMNKQAIPLKFSQNFYNRSFLFLGNVVLIPSSSVLTAARQDPSPIWCQPSSQLTTSLTDSTWSRSVSKTDCLCTHQTTKHVMTCHSHSLFLWFFSCPISQYRVLSCSTCIIWPRCPLPCLLSAITACSWSIPRILSGSSCKRACVCLSPQMTRYSSTTQRSGRVVTGNDVHGIKHFRH